MEILDDCDWSGFWMDSHVKIHIDMQNKDKIQEIIGVLKEIEALNEEDYNHLRDAVRVVNKIDRYVNKKS